MTNPQKAITRSGMKLNLNFTEPIRDPEKLRQQKFSRKLDEDQDLKKWCESACQERVYYQKEALPDETQEMEVDICYKCFDVTKAHLEFVKFNYDVATQKVNELLFFLIYIHKHNLTFSRESPPPTLATIP